jgi:hypothetical protein
MQDTFAQYICKECGLHYESQDLVRKCQAWCAEFKSCNLDITKLSLEASESKNGNVPFSAVS